LGIEHYGEQLGRIRIYELNWEQSLAFGFGLDPLNFLFGFLLLASNLGLHVNAHLLYLLLR
jgi:hypothetical protein